MPKPYPAEFRRDVIAVARQSEASAGTSSTYGQRLVGTGVQPSDDVGALRDEHLVHLSSGDWLERHRQVWLSEVPLAVHPRKSHEQKERLSDAYWSQVSRN